MNKGKKLYTGTIYGCFSCHEKSVFAVSKEEAEKKLKDDSARYLQSVGKVRLGGKTPHKPLPPLDLQGLFLPTISRPMVSLMSDIAEVKPLKRSEGVFYLKIKGKRRRNAKV